MEKGKFIVLDGIDGSGKATQTRLLHERLKREGVNTEKIDFPGYDRNLFGALIKEALAGKLGDFRNLDPKIASTLYACDRLESSPQILQWLEGGAVVVADRFSTSNQIHQGGKIEDETKREEFLGWLDAMEHTTLSIPRPHLVIYLRVPSETSLELLRRDRVAKNDAIVGTDVVESDISYVEQSYATAQWLATKFGWKVVECTNDGVMRAPEDIAEEVYSIVKSQMVG